MRKFLTGISSLVAATCLFAPSMASADDVTLRLEPGVAVPLTHPQTDRFKPGGDFAIKPTLGILPWLDANLTLSGMALPSKLSAVDYGQSLGVGLGARVKRPHDESNTGTGFSAVSPWVDADGQYIRTGALDRFAWSAAVGASVPTGEDRAVWVGPFVRYLDVVESLNVKPKIDNTDAHVLILGVSFELGVPHKKKEAVVEAPKPPPPVVEKKEVPKVEEPAPKAPDPVTLTIDVKVQFPFDSAIPLPESNAPLATVLKALLDHPGYNVQVEGHASSEGRVAYNEKLSVRRAQFVADYLIKNGVPANSLTVKGFGPHVPVASNETELGRALNRRVEFNVSLTLTKEGSK